MIVVVAIFKDEVAPCFEAAKKFLLFQVENNRVVAKQILRCNTRGPIARLRLLSDTEVDILICNGIRSFYRDMLEAEGRKVYKNISGKVDDVLGLYLSGRIDSFSGTQSDDAVPCKFELQELLQMTVEYFSRKGYNIISDELDFPVDIMAEFKCPRCHKPIHVAVCCGGHLFCWEKEIKELRRISENYDATVYVHASQESVVKSCNDFKINLLDPWILENFDEDDKAIPIPILKIPVTGHEKIYEKNNL